MLNSGPHRPSGCWLLLARSRPARRSARCAPRRWSAPSSGQKASWLARHAASAQSLEAGDGAPLGGGRRRLVGVGCGRSPPPSAWLRNELRGLVRIVAADDHRAQRHQRRHRRRAWRSARGSSRAARSSGRSCASLSVGYRSVYRQAGPRIQRMGVAAPEWGACPTDPLVLEIPYADPARPLRPGRRRFPRGPPAQRRRRRARAPLVHRRRPVQGARVPRGARGRSTAVPVPGAPSTSLRAELARHPQAPAPGPPPFQGGAVGYVGYELGRHLERLPRPARRPDGRARDAAAVLRRGGRLRPPRAPGAHHLERPARDRPATRAGRARARLRAVGPPLRRRPARRAARARPRPPPGSTPGHPARGLRDARSARVVDYILAGDVFQVNLSQRLRAELPDGADPLRPVPAPARAQPGPVRRPTSTSATW